MVHTSFLPELSILDPYILPRGKYNYNVCVCVCVCACARIFLWLSSFLCNLLGDWEGCFDLECWAQAFLSAFGSPAASSPGGSRWMMEWRWSWLAGSGPGLEGSLHPPQWFHHPAPERNPSVVPCPGIRLREERHTSWCQALIETAELGKVMSLE